MTRRLACALAVLAVLVAGGCVDQPDKTDAAASVRDSRDQVLAALRKAAAVLGRDGEVRDGAGRYLTCGSSPTDAVEYRAGAKLAGSGPVGDRIRAAAEALRSDGWTLGDHAWTDDPRPFARLERDGLRLSIDPDQLRGSEAVTFGVVGDCIRVAKGQTGSFEDDPSLDVTG